MELAKEVIREVISDRCAFTSSLDVEQRHQHLESTVKEAEVFLANGLRIAIHILLGHDQCKAKELANCKACCEVEVWTVQVSTLIGGDFTGKSSIFPTFLKHAIRSQLHFSPTKSWFCSLKNNDNGEMKDYKCVYRISPSSYFQNETENFWKIDQHKFPPCKLDERLISVSVKWLKKEHFPAKMVKCPSKRVDVQLWVSPEIGQEKKTLHRKNSKEIKIVELQTGVEFNLEKKSGREKRANNIVVELPERSPEIPSRQNLSSSNKLSHLHSTSSYKFHNNNSLNKNAVSSHLTLSAKHDELAAHRKLLHRFLEHTPSPYSRCLKRRLLCNFEESVLKGCLQPIHVVDGFKLQLAITANSLATKHMTIPVTTSYFNEELSSLYMSNCAIPSVLSSSKCKPGIQIPRQCLLQVVLFNTQGSVVKIFLLQIDVNDMPPLSQTFIRQRTYTKSSFIAPPLLPGRHNVSPPVSASYLEFVTTGSDNASCSTGTESNRGDRSTSKRDNYITGGQMSGNISNVLKYLIHVRLLSDHRGRIFIYGDMKMLLSNKGSDLEGLVAAHTQSVTLMPQYPKYSPIK